MKKKMNDNRCSGCKNDLFINVGKMRLCSLCQKRLIDVYTAKKGVEDNDRRNIFC